MLFLCDRPTHPFGFNLMLWHPAHIHPPNATPSGQKRFFFFLQKPYLLEWISRYSLRYDARRDQTRRYASESLIDTFSVLSRHLVKNVFLQKPYLLEWISRYSLYYDARRDQTKRYASESAIDTFSMLSVIPTSCPTRFSTKTFVWH